MPIVNDNDPVKQLVPHPAVPADNDALAAKLAIACEADLLVLLSNVDGVFSADPRTDPNARRLRLLESPERELARCEATKSDVGTGGMRSKLIAASLASREGIDVVIASGSRPRVVLDAAEGSPECGTRIPMARRTASVRPRAAGPGELHVHEAGAAG